MAMDFPNTPTLGQVFNNYTWDGEKWVSTAITGVPEAPNDGKQYARKSLAWSPVAAGGTSKNYIMNGGIQISQEAGSAGVSANGAYVADGFQFLKSGTTGSLLAAQVASITPGGSPNRIRLTVTTADAVVDAGDYVRIRQSIEGIRTADLLQGTASAKTVTLQFGVKAPAGTYCILLQNDALNLSYIAEYVVAAGEANIDVVKSVTVALCTTGTWVNDINKGIIVTWVFMAGSNVQGAPNTWLPSSPAIATANQFNIMGSTSNVFELFDISLTVGATAAPFVLADFASEFALCQRYYQKSYNYADTVPTTLRSTVAFIAITTAAVHVGTRFPVTMRSNPTLTLYSFNGTSGAISTTAFADTAAANATGVSEGGFTTVTSSGLTAGAGYIGNYTANARL